MLTILGLVELPRVEGAATNFTNYTNGSRMIRVRFVSFVEFVAGPQSHDHDPGASLDGAQPNVGLSRVHTEVDRAIIRGDGEPLDVVGRNRQNRAHFS